MEFISVVIITNNEEKNIGRCLESVKTIADEIVVVDSFSTDATQEICKKYNATFIQNEWMGFGDTKNFALSQCQYPFVLSLDADEELSDELKKSILEIKSNKIYDAYSFNRLTNYCGTWIRHGGWYPDKKLRLFDKTKGRWEGGNIHEYVQMQPASLTFHLKGDLYHYSYYTISEHIKQIDNFTKVQVKDLFQSGIRFTWWKLIFKPLFRFIKGYVVQGGWRDGYYGFIIAVSSAYAIFLRYASLLEMERNESLKL